MTTAPERRCEPGCLPFSSTATGTSPSRSRVSGRSSSSWPSRIAQASPPGPPPTIRMPTSIRSSARVGRRGDRLGGRERRRVVGRADAAHVTPCAPAGARSASARSACRSPTTPRSANSKIGAFGSLLIATIVPELCMPTLCWIAPEMPQRDVELRRDGLAGLADLGRVRVPARVDDRARRGDRAAERRRELLDQREVLRARRARGRRRRSRPRPRSTGRSTPPVRLLDQLGRERVLLQLHANVLDRRRPPAARPGRTRRRGSAPSRGVVVQPTSTTTVSPSADCLPTSSPPSLDDVGEVPVEARRRGARRARRRCRRRAPTARRGRSRSPSRATSCAIASTRGCGSGAASLASSTT